MEARELRIGNIAEYLITRNPDIWEEFTTSPATYGRIIIEPERYRGIPLTEDWLKRFGFEVTIETTWSFGYDKKFNVWRLNGFTYNQIQAAWWYNGAVLKHQPEFVHQLQNLYFALNGSELTPNKTDNK